MTSTTSTTKKRRTEVRRWGALGLILVVLGIASGQGRAASEPGPRGVIQETVDQVLAVLNDPDLSKPERLLQIEVIVYRRFDFRTMSKQVLARNWKRFSEAQREEFQREFKDYLAYTYGARLNRFDQQRVEIIGERTGPRGHVTVLTKIMGGENSGATVDYVLIDREGRWRIFDVIVEGISFVSNYRDQFRQVLSGGGPDHLLAKLREKNHSGSPEATPAAAAGARSSR